MKIEDFINQMAKIKPNENKLIEEGFSGVHLSVIKSNFIILPKKSVSIHIYPTLVETLVKNFEAEFIRFGDFTFLKDIKLIDNFKIFGVSSYSFLAIASSEEILEIDNEELSIVNRCAENSKSFLRALICVSDLLSKRLQGLVAMEDHGTSNEYLAKATELAGGKKYLNFYKSIL